MLLSSGLSDLLLPDLELRMNAAAAGHEQHDGGGQNYYNNYFNSHLDRGRREALYRMYQRDFELFGYSTDGYL